MGPSYDDSQWPLYRIRLTPHVLTESEFLAYIKHIDDLFLRGDRFAVVMDARDAPSPSPKERQVIAQHIRASHARYPHRLAAMAVVMNSSLQRGVFTAINWLAGPTYPMRPYATTEEAEIWLRQMLALPKGSGEHRVAGGEP